MRTNDYGFPRTWIVCYSNDMSARSLRRTSKKHCPQCEQLLSGDACQHCGREQNAIALGRIPVDSYLRLPEFQRIGRFVTDAYGITPGEDVVHAVFERETHDDGSSP